MAMLTLTTLALCFGVTDDVVELHGLKLSEDKLIDLKTVDDLYKSAKDNPKKRIRRGSGDVFQMPLIKSSSRRSNPQPASAWLYYPPRAGRFYVSYRANSRKPETEKQYGPFDGNPFERLGLEKLMAERLKSDYSPDDFFRIKLMFRTEHPELMSRAVRLIGVALDTTITGPTLDNNMRSLREVVRENTELLKKSGLGREALLTKKKLADADKQVRSLTVEIPKSEYRRASEVSLAAPADVDNALWGPKVTGLRVAAILKTTTTKLNASVPVQIVLENVSDEPIWFSEAGLNQDYGLEWRRGTGRQQYAQGTWYSGMPALTRIWLEPGERITLIKPSVAFQTEDGKPVSGFGTKTVRMKRKDGLDDIQVRFRIHLGLGSSWRNDNGVMKRTSPARGEYSGSMYTAWIPVEIKED